MEPIKLNGKAARQVQELIDNLRQAQERINVYVAAAGAALDVPDGWQLDPQAMAFVPPPEPATEDGGDA
jgi:hypothetical protein